MLCAAPAARREAFDPDNNGMLPLQGSFHDATGLLGRSSLDALAKAEELTWCCTPIYGERLVHGDHPGISDGCGSRQ